MISAPGGSGRVICVGFAQFDDGEAAVEVTVPAAIWATKSLAGRRTSAGGVTANVPAVAGEPPGAQPVPVALDRHRAAFAAAGALPGRAVHIAVAGVADAVAGGGARPAALCGARARHSRAGLCPGRPRSAARAVPAFGGGDADLTGLSGRTGVPALAASGLPPPIRAKSSCRRQPQVNTVEVCADQLPAQRPAGYRSGPAVRRRPGPAGWPPWARSSRRCTGFGGRATRGVSADSAL